MRRLSRTLLLALCALGCYEPPGESETNDPKPPTVERVDSKTAVADGVTLLEFDIKTAQGTKPDTAIDIEVSSGTVNMTAAPGSTDSRKLRLTVGNVTKRTVPVRTGLTPGPFTLVVKIGSTHITEELLLDPSLPHGVTLTASRTRLPANGADTLSVVAALWSAASLDRNPSPSLAQVSSGSRVTFVVCCRNADFDTEPCTQAPPLRVPALAETGATPSVTVSAVSEYRTGSRSGETLELFIVGDVSDGWASCESSDSDSGAGGGANAGDAVGTRAVLPVSMQLQAPPSADGGT